MAHTPGPWFVQADRIASDGGDIAAVHYQSSREQKGWHCMDDARLIAAAPDLLYGCKAALADLEGLLAGHDDHPGFETMKELRQFIANAEGK